MSERWCKLYPHALTDPLWLAVADDAGTSPGLVGATFVELLTWTTEHAPDTGSIAGFDPRVWAAWLRIAPEAVERIIASLRKFGRIVGDTIANWAKRQGAAVAAVAANVNKMVRKVSTPRTRKHRARDRQGELLLPIAGTPARVPEGVPAFPERVPDVPDAKTEAISAPCPASEKEKERDPDSFSLGKGENEKGASGRCALSDRPPAGEMRAKRANLIKTLGRWVRYSGLVPDNDEQVHRLLMLGRAEAALDCWDTRTVEDKRAFDFLDKRARDHPLTRDMVLACEQAERDDARRRMTAGWGRAAA
jgi:hypothetical protein